MDGRISLECETKLDKLSVRQQRQVGAFEGMSFCVGCWQEEGMSSRARLGNTPLVPSNFGRTWPVHRLEVMIDFSGSGSCRWRCIGCRLLHCLAAQFIMSRFVFKLPGLSIGAASLSALEQPEADELIMCEVCPFIVTHVYSHLNHTSRIYAASLLENLYSPHRLQH
jgi:hypothetical protein